MHSFVICPLRDSKKIDLEICLVGCESQWQCDPFNRAMCKTRAKEAEKGIEEPKPASTTPKEQPEDADVTEKITEGVPAVLSRNKAEELYKQVLSLKTEIEVRWFELGKILQEIFEGRHYINLGYKNWKNFCEIALGPLDLKWRAIDYLRMTRKKCDEIGIGREIAGQIGWSRLKEIEPIITKENKDYWIDIARKNESTVSVLWKKVQVALGKKTEKEVEIFSKKMIFPLFPEQEQIVKLTLDVAGKVAASDKIGYLLADIICPEFLSAFPSESDNLTMPKGQVLHRILTDIQAAFKVRFTGEVVDLETGEILVESK